MYAPVFHCEPSRARKRAAATESPQPRRDWAYASQRPRLSPASPPERSGRVQTSTHTLKAARPWMYCEGPHAAHARAKRAARAPHTILPATAPSSVSSHSTHCTAATTPHTSARHARRLDGPRLGLDDSSATPQASAGHEQRRHHHRHTRHTTDRRCPTNASGAHAGTVPVTIPTAAWVAGLQDGPRVRSYEPYSLHAPVECAVGLRPPRDANELPTHAHATFERMYRCACERNSG